jgi:hypothetical protein
MEPETKKGFLAIGVILSVCLCVAAVLAFLGWNWWNNSGLANMVNQGMNRPPIDMERSEFEAYLKNLGYACDDKPTSEYGDYEIVNCGKKIQGESFTLTVTYSKKHNQPVSMTAAVKMSDSQGQAEIIAREFTELVRIPYKGSRPDEAAAWMNHCWEFDDIDSLTVTKTISDVTFSFLMYAGQYQLVIGSKYPFEFTPEN